MFRFSVVCSDSIDEPLRRSGSWPLTAIMGEMEDGVYMYASTYQCKRNEGKK